MISEPTSEPMASSVGVGPGAVPDDLEPRGPSPGSAWLALGTLALIAALWLLVHRLIVVPAGSGELAALNLLCAAVLGLLTPIFATPKTDGHRHRGLRPMGSLRPVLLATIPLPFLALIILPLGLRAFVSAVLGLPLGLAALDLFAAPRWTNEGSSARRTLAALVLAFSGFSLALILFTDPTVLWSVLWNGPWASASSNAATEVTATLLNAGKLGVTAVVLGASALLLAQRWGQRGLLTALAVVLVAGPSAFASWALLFTAMTESLFDRRTIGGPWGRVWGRPRHPKGARSLVPVNLALPLTLVASLLIGAVITLSWAALLLPLGLWARRKRRGWLAATVVIGALMALVREPTEWSGVGLGLLAAALLLPFVIVGFALGTSRRAGDDAVVQAPLEHDGRWRLLTGLVLAVVGLRLFGSAVALVPLVVHWLAPLRSKEAVTPTSESFPPEAFQPENGWTENKPSETLRPSLATGVAAPSSSKTERDRAERDRAGRDRAERDEDNGAGHSQSLWLGLWLAVLALGATYPWFGAVALVPRLRQALSSAAAFTRSLSGALESPIAGLAPIAFAALAVLFLALLVEWRSARWSWLRALVPVGFLVMVAALLWGLLVRPPQVLHRWPPLVLTTSQPTAQLDVSGTLALERLSNSAIAGATIALRIDSMLSNAGGLPIGTPVAEVRLRIPPTPDQPPVELRGTLLAGVHSAEWRTTSEQSLAPQNTDIHVAGPVVLVWFVTDDQPPLLGRRYRGTVPLAQGRHTSGEAPSPGSTGLAQPALEIWRATSLPAAVEVRLDQIALVTRSAPSTADP